MFEITQSTVNDPRRAACCAGGEVVLLDDQRTASRARTFTSDRDAIDSAAYDRDVEMSAVDGRARLWPESHTRLDASPLFGGHNFGFCRILWHLRVVRLRLL